MKHRSLCDPSGPDMAPPARESYWADPFREMGWQRASRTVGRSLRNEWDKMMMDQGGKRQ